MDTACSRVSAAATSWWDAARGCSNRRSRFSKDNSQSIRFERSSRRRETANSPASFILSDTVRAEAKGVSADLREEGVEQLTMLTGDRRTGRGIDSPSKSA